MLAHLLSHPNREQDSHLHHNYKRDGMLLLKNILPTQRIHALLSEVHHCFALQCKAVGIKPTSGTENLELLRDMQALLAADVERYKSAARQSANLLSMHRMLTDPAITNIVHTLGLTTPSIPTGPVINIMAKELQVPGGYHTLEAHQDWHSMQGSLDAIILWVPLMPVHQNRYTLEIIPGSHKQGLLPGKLHPHIFEIAAKHAKDEAFTPIIAEPGDIAIISAFTVHRTTNKKGSGVRIACSLRYENVDEATFIERKFPNAYKRTVEREFITPNFPSAEEVQRIFE